MSSFRVHYAGILDATHRRDLGFRLVTSQALNKLWAGTKLAGDHGVYVFALKRRGRGAAVPFYVGEAGQDDLQDGDPELLKNRRAFTAALLESEGTPEMYLVVMQYKVGRINYKAIDDLETLLIWIARHRNPAGLDPVSWTK